jgi:hypothetical protein
MYCLDKKLIIQIICKKGNFNKLFIEENYTQIDFTFNF